MFLKTIDQYIRKNHLLNKDSKYLVALSGGADSTALLLIASLLGYRIEAIHCNFRLRGEESDRDEQFCQTLCTAHNIPFHTVHFDTREYASLHKESIELAARHLRYAYFEQLRKDIGAEAILVAHHQDDDVETILMNFLRGTGLHGMTGIHPRRDNIIRPLLCVSRKEIEAFLKENDQNYVTDSSNLIDDVTRNKIRIDLIPRLKEINANAVENILTTSRHLSQVEEYIQSPSPDTTEYGLYLSLKDYGFTPKVIEDIYEDLHTGASTGNTYESDSYELLIDRGHIIVQQKTAPFKGMRIPETGTYILPKLPYFRPSVGQRSNIEVLAIDETEHRIKVQSAELSTLPSFNIPKEPYKIALDADKVKFPLTLRTVKEGDRFRPFGMHGTRLVSDYLTDRKRNLFDKRRQLVMEDATGNIVWLVGERTSDDCKVATETRQVLIIEII